MPLQFHTLKVATVRYDTAAAVQIGFRIPKKIVEAFRFEPGQYLTISLTIDGKKVRRAYSICSATHVPIVSVLIKRVEGGLVSNYLNDNVKVGDKFDVLPPSGHFKLTIDPENQQLYYFLGAGSGITPLASMISSVLETEPLSHCYLLYGNRDEDNIIYHKQLERLAMVYKKRFKLQLILSRPRKVKSGFLQSAKTTWQGQVGRVNLDSISKFITAIDKPANGYYICGPGPMIEASYQSLLDLKVDKSLIHKEYFSAPVSEETELAAVSRQQITANVKVILDNKTIELVIDDDRDLVTALLDKNVEPPYSCLSGTCSTCMAKLEKGEVAMDVSIGLEDDEKEKGYILTCQSHPLTEEVIVNFDKATT